MSHSFRPPLGARATSDMAPLVNAEPNSSKGEIARGSHVVHGGIRVTSGTRTALGGVAPFSPFLPLPPAPTAEELRRQCSQDGNQSSNGSKMINQMISLEQKQAEMEDASSHWLQPPEIYQRRASSHDINEMPKPAVVETRKPTPNPAAFMIRSYSMPVATQKDFDAQQRAARLQRKQRSNLGYTPAWSMSRTDSANGDSERLPLRTVQASEMNAISLTRTVSRSANADHHSQMSRWETSNESSSPADSGTTSCSDETDVATPRAITPLNESASFFDIKHQDDPTQAMGDLHIHPDHLQPPPFLLTSS
ncbi:uncharacterized protein FA14DRAFT_154608 [Meira miltonrushii]|uniref:Uncharacterized protein n=1 Tax=Meira miltonrushii TaxID=1280837 RepID=A0A316VCZ7_9BASI|nr:uncharacterized protein FA14DRAFT_154608 [Meira miltonrushii]PWN35184.1 hypothetical protein FA14DRAFT_154608 [Meira miltonrushii]